MIILMLITQTKTQKITSLKNKKFMLLETHETFNFEKEDYLFHIFNITQITQRYKEIKHSTFKRTAKDIIKEHKIENLLKQLELHDRKPRSLDFIGSFLKFIGGTPDRYEINDIKEHINDIIDNNNKQRVINSQIENLLSKLDLQITPKELIIQETLEELETLFYTINLAKTGTFLSKSLNIKDIQTILSKETIDIPILNVMEYSKINIVKYKETFIIVYKYPIILEKCKLYNVIPLTFRHGKLMLDQFISKCNNEYKRVSDCKLTINSYICKLEDKNNCITLLLNNDESRCNVKEENNAPIQEYPFGNIIISGKHEINNDTYKGTFLIQTNDTVQIDGKNYTNLEEQSKHVTTHEANTSIQQIYDSQEEYQFSNIQKLHRLIIPIEEHPIQAICYLSLSLITIIFIVWTCIKCCKLQNQRQEMQKLKEFQKFYTTSLLRK